MTGNKNIVLCSDGTGNRGIKARGSNVFKLYEAVDIQGHRQGRTTRPQVAFYDDGVGTQSLPPLKILGGALGWGFSKNIRDLYTELVHAYSPGDSLYLFGFSRGAYTIRALAGMIQYCGIVDVAKGDELGTKKGLEDHVKGCWKAFHKAAFTSERNYERLAAIPENRAPASGPVTIDPATVARRQGFLAHEPRRPISIRFLGVWDTVGAVGMPVDELKFVTDWVWPSRFNDLTVGREVERACHALAIDDERRTFWPELWNAASAVEGQLEQVWFAGAHSNVGGGYPKHGMSLVALDWMMAEAEAKGLAFIPADREYARTHQDVHDKLYDSRAGLGLYYRWKPRDIGAICSRHAIARPKIHVSVFERIAMGTDAYRPGNIPADIEVVGTRGVPFPDPGQADAIGRLVASGHEEGPASSLLSRTATRRWVALGRFSHLLFLAITVAFVAVGLRRSLPRDLGDRETTWLQVKALASAVGAGVASPLASLDELWPYFGRAVLSWWFLPGMVTCWVLARLVDRGMERCFESFWHGCRTRLRNVLRLD